MICPRLTVLPADGDDGGQVETFELRREVMTRHSRTACVARAGETSNRETSVCCRNLSALIRRNILTKMQTSSVFAAIIGVLLLAVGAQSTQELKIDVTVCSSSSAARNRCPPMVCSCTVAYIAARSHPVGTHVFACGMLERLRISAVPFSQLRASLVPTWTIIALTGRTVCWIWRPMFILP